jgi:serine/threonine protein kinase
VSDEGETKGTPAPATARSPIADLAGRQLLHFKIVERLGAGGMGVVYRAFDTKLRRDVAIKALSARYLADDRNKELIFREARSAAAVSHPNIAAIYEVHDLEEAAFLVMELVDGETLRARLARGAVTRDEAMRIAREIARGLARAHEHGIVHRDLKPDNVMLARDGHVKLLDFGLAKVAVEAEPVAEGAADATGTTLAAGTRGRVMGTPGYMSPEQARGQLVDTRTDVYAFGVVLYELFAGGKPFEHRSTTPEEWTEEAWQARPPFKGPREVAAIVARCLAIDPVQRYRNGGELIAALEARIRRRWPWVALPLVAAAGVAAIVINSSPPIPHRRYAVTRQLDDAFDLFSLNGTELLGVPSPAATVEVLGLADGKHRTLDLPPGDPISYAEETREGLVVVRVPKGTTDATVWIRSRSSNEMTRGRDAPDLQHCRVSPNGTMLAWTTQDGAFIGDLRGGPAKRVYRPATKSVLLKVAWSPSGDAVAVFATSSCGGEGWVDVISLDGRTTRVVEERLVSQSCVSGLAWPREHELLVTRRSEMGHLAAILGVDPLAASPTTWIAYETQREVELGTLDTHDGRVLALAVAAPTMLYTGSLDNGRLIGSLRSEPLESGGVELWGVLDSAHPLLAHALVPSTTLNYDVVIRDAAKETPFARVDDVSRGSRPTLRPDAALLISRGHDGTCTLIAVTAGASREVGAFPCGDASVQCGDTGCVLGEVDSRGDAMFSQFDPWTGKKSAAFYYGAPRGFALSPNGRVLATGMAEAAGFRLFDIASHDTREVRVAGRDVIQLLASVSDDAFLAVGYSPSTSIDRISMDGSVEALWRSPPNTYFDQFAISPDRKSFAFRTREIHKGSILLAPE